MPILEKPEQSVIQADKKTPYACPECGAELIIKVLQKNIVYNMLDPKTGHWDPDCWKDDEWLGFDWKHSSIECSENQNHRVKWFFTKEGKLHQGPLPEKE